MAPPPPAIVLGATGLVFVASAIAFARGRDGFGGLLAFIGTALFGNGIWLVARAVHLDGHYPDAALWWAIGALLTAHLLKSRSIGIQAALVTIAWVFLETALFARPAYACAGLATGLVWLAYRTRSAAVLTAAVVSIAVWIVAMNLYVFSRTGLLSGARWVAGAGAIALIVMLVLTRIVRRRRVAATVPSATTPGPRPRTRAMAAVLSGVTLVALLGGVLVKHAWPLWTGQLVYLRIRPVDSRDLIRVGHVALSYPIEDVTIRVPGEPVDATPPDPAGPPPSLLPPLVEAIGDWWRVDEETARGWRDREFYLQLKAQPSGAPGVAEEHRPVTISARPVPDALNLAGRVVFFTTFDYSFRLQFGLDAFPADASTARLIDEAMQRDAPIYAEVTVARAGRARVRALIVDGRRVQ